MNPEAVVGCQLPVVSRKGKGGRRSAAPVFGKRHFATLSALSTIFFEIFRQVALGMAVAAVWATRFEPNRKR
jgi:hypothetical protein